MTQIACSPHHLPLETLEDVRRAASCQQNFIDIPVITVCAITANADTWEEMEEFGDEKEGWLRTFLELPNGIPSHNTFLGWPEVVRCRDRTINGKATTLLRFYCSKEMIAKDMLGAMRIHWKVESVPQAHK